MCILFLFCVDKDREFFEDVRWVDVDGGVSLALKKCVYVPILMSQRRPRTWVGSIEKYPGPRVPPIFRWYVPTQGFLHGIDNTRVLRGIIFSKHFPLFISNVYLIYLGE